MKNKSIINININDKESVLSPFSNDKVIISSDLVEFLDYKLSPVVIKNDIQLNISCKNLEEEDKKIYEQAIKNYYEDLYHIKKREVHRKTLISLILLLAGIFVIAITLILEETGNNIIKARVNDIVAWVFVWEAVDIFFFQRPKVSFDKRKSLKMMNATISYV